MMEDIERGAKLAIGGCFGLLILFMVLGLGFTLFVITVCVLS